MPSRRKPTATSKLKAEKKLKKAIKRGDVLPPTNDKPRKPKPGGRTRMRLGPTGQILNPEAAATSQANIDSARRLQSAFTKVSPEFLAETKRLAASMPLPRPIPLEAALLTTSQTGEIDAKLAARMSVPKRPKWRFDMTKKEVDSREEGMFKTWLTEMDTIVAEWVESANPPQSDQTADHPEPPSIPTSKTMPRSPTHFERNLEVWRQLWRVTEISQIILVLIDSRCPLLHFPPSLSSCLSDRRIILVLTKVDISGSARATSWTTYLNAHFPGLRVVQVEAYMERAESAVHQGRTLYAPHVPDTFRERLVQALKEVHEEMLQPPERIRAAVDAGTKHWKPPVKQEINWEAVVKARGGPVGHAVGGPAVSKGEADENEDAEGSEKFDREPEFLTVGLIGQPNVGKSSLLNALFGTQKVRASRTPGKTKHFQTLFWTPDLRLVDCPGLVMPNLVPMEVQVLAGILPISRVSATAACVHYISQYLQLEKILDLTHPSLTAPPVEDKRTWREGTKPKVEPKTAETVVWTAMDILTAFCEKKKWVTAKAGRPDVSRAGNYILRTVAEGRIRWAFWPPNTDIATLQESAGTGIWIPHTLDDLESDDESEDEEGVEQTHKVNSNSEEAQESDSDEEEILGTVGGGRFGALQIASSGDDEEDTESNEEEA